MTENIPPSAKHLIYYDGSCGLCHFSVSWIIRHDPKFLFVFKPQETEEDSLVLIENFQSPNAKEYRYGKAALKALSHLYPIATPLYYLPKFIVDPVYRFIARNRSSLFKKPECPVPTEFDQRRFI